MSQNFRPPGAGTHPDILMRQIDNAIRGGDIPTAGALAEQALAAGVEHPGVLNLAAHQCVGRGQLPRAVGLLERARQIAPRDVHVLNSLGNVLKRMGRLDAALEAFEAGIAAAPDFATAHFNRGSVLESKGAPDDARAAYQRAVELEPDFADALGRLSFLAAMRGDYDAAIAFGDRAVAQVAGEPPAIQKIVQFAITRGDRDAALTMARRAVEQAPGDTSAVLLLAHAEIDASELGAARARLQPLVDDPKPVGDTRALALTLLARIEEKEAHYPEALAAFAASKAEMGRNYAHAFTPPAMQPYLARVERELAYFAQADAGAWRAKPENARPSPVATHVFLVGFPRSGTTLLEKSLSAHSQIAAMEEEESFAPCIRDFFDPDDGFAKFAGLPERALDGYRAAYWNICRGAAPGLEGKVFIDKMPLNTVMLPFVAKLFPTAKVLFALRDPRDVVLSCLKQQFALTAAMYEFCSLESSARLYDSVMSLAAIFRDTLGLETLETRYEDFVADIDAATHRIAGFLGIAWEESMRDVTASMRAKPITTPSAAQVARGLYDGSGAWRRYRDEMAPVLPVLAPWVEKFGYTKD